MQFFLVALGASFLYYALPGYLFPILTFFSFIGSIVLIVMSCQPTKPAPETLFDKVE